ncbi:MAG: preprotein translocase subunit YajC [Cloacibacterium sp.]|jgi:preprotein translocase subunit YajC|nr:preprotein translocase subunit YajC [Cloacibacterium sp.]
MDLLTTVLPMLVMFTAFYFLMIRPQIAKQKKEKSFQDSLKPGTRVVTTSGIHGRIVTIADDGVVIETMAGKIKFEKAAISRDLTTTRFPENSEK